jgi:hypothetical protein
LVSLSTAKPLEILEAIYVYKPDQRDLTLIPKDITTRTGDKYDLEDDVRADSSSDESSRFRRLVTCSVAKLFWTSNIEVPIEKHFRLESNNGPVRHW